MTPSKQVEATRKILQSVKIPPRAEVVLEIQRLLKTADPDLTAVANLVNQDPALVARLFKLIKSPLFRIPREPKTTHDVLMVLGLDTFYRTVITTSLQQAFNSIGNDKNIQLFWDVSLICARLGELIAKKLILGKDMENQAYLCGLFHDCGAPIMHAKFKKQDYDAFFENALSYEPSIIAKENAAFHSDHAVIGYLMTKSWNMPQAVCETTRYHHLNGFPAALSEGSHTVFSVFKITQHTAISLAADTVHEKIALWPEETGAPYLKELELSPKEYLDLQEGIGESLSTS